LPSPPASSCTRSMTAMRSRQTTSKPPAMNIRRLRHRMGGGVDATSLELLLLFEGESLEHVAVKAGRFSAEAPRVVAVEPAVVVGASNCGKLPSGGRGKLRADPQGLLLPLPCGLVASAAASPSPPPSSPRETSTRSSSLCEVLTSGICSIMGAYLRAAVAEPFLRFILYYGSRVVVNVSPSRARGWRSRSTERKALWSSDKESLECCEARTWRRGVLALAFVILGTVDK
jgi:hypothetical protein